MLKEKQQQIQEAVTQIREAVEALTLEELVKVLIENEIAYVYDVAPARNLIIHLTENDQQGRAEEQIKVWKQHGFDYESNKDAEIIFRGINIFGESYGMRDMSLNLRRQNIKDIAEEGLHIPINRLMSTKPANMLCVDNSGEIKPLFRGGNPGNIWFDKDVEKTSLKWDHGKHARREYARIMEAICIAIDRKMIELDKEKKAETKDK